MDHYTADIDLFRSPYSVSEPNTYADTKDCRLVYKNNYATVYNSKFGDSDEPSADNKDTPIKDEKEPLAEDLITWSEFTENTTFHGIKYVFQPSFKFRR